MRYLLLGLVVFLSVQNSNAGCNPCICQPEEFPECRSANLDYNKDLISIINKIEIKK